MGRIIKLNIDLSVLYEHAEEIKTGINFFLGCAEVISMHFFKGREKERWWVCHSPDAGYYDYFLPYELTKLLNEVEVYDEHGNPINPEDRIAEELSKRGDVVYISIHDGYECLYYYALLK